MAAERYFHSLWSNGVLDVLAVFAAQYGLWVCAAAAAFAWLRRKPRGAVVPFVLGAVAAASLDFVAGLLIHEARPFVAIGVAPLVPHSSDNGFPSDHCAAAAYFSVAASFFDPIAAWIAAAAAFALGLGRAYSLLHTPQDVIAGWLIGAVPALAAGFYWKLWTKASARKTARHREPPQPL